MVVVRAAAGGEAAALVVITILGVIGNAVVVVTLLRRSLLHHPSNRLVLSLTASNLLLTLVVLPVLVASVVLGPPYHDPNSPPRTTFLVLASQNSSLANATEQGVSALRLERSVAPEEVTSHDVDPQPVWESLEGEQDLAESWMGPDNATRGLEEEEETAVQDRVGSAWGGGGGVGSAALCQGAAFLANLVTAASAITVAIIALDRYLAIVRPMVYGVTVTGNRCLVLLAWCWVQATLTALPPLLGWARYEHHGPEGRCGVAWDSSPSYTSIWVLSVFVVPIVIMLICYYFILQVARNKCRRIHVGTVLGSRGSTITPDASSVCVEVPAPPSSTSLEVPPGNGTTLPHELSLPRANGHVVGNGRGPDTGQKVPGSGPDAPSLPVPTLLVSGLEVPKGGPVIPNRSRSVNGVNRVTEVGGATLVPKRRLAECGRSLSFSQQRSQLVRPCLRRAQSNISMRPSTIRKKLSIGGRKPSWSWEASPAKGFRTVCVVVGTHVFSWAPYTALAVVEAVLGPQRTDLIPHWATVTSTLLLFTASVFYPIVYGLYNRSIRKEVLACVCPSSSRARRRSCHRHASTLNSNTGSVLDFSSLRQRDSDEQQQQQQQQEILAANTLNKGCNPVPIKTISGTLTPLPPLLQLTECEGLPLRGYNFSARKPSQDSGAVMGSTDDTDSDLEGTVPPPQPHRPARRVSAPSILDTVCEDPFITRAVVHSNNMCGGGGSRRGSSSSNSSSVSRTSLSVSRKLPILPLSPQLLRARYNRRLPMWRSHSLEKLSSSGDSCQESLLLLKKGVLPSPKTKNFLSPLVRETQFGELARDRSQRRGSASARKVMAIPEDTGILECPEISDSGRGSVDSGEANKSRANREISIDEGIGAECLMEEDSVSNV
ncbi:uncharacterized protein LOC123501679 isoform X2 [Portunus trituberculatus]|uniref:uncharacterized protein LOC123501679 isoform X2 n=1 Tax=Portunus trituberculatus TaxID=210409 RepID=UPI001E1D16D1|nr:uncharacterized protein LOC123501679 isoform X2 [Portunus trituberculatus]